ncbi:MAG: ribosomal RNA small subunit methyltransferase A [Thermoprotei archaeon]|nr:MAG: ribosomal RNA small subunit methyltransferase A [Thermoprotei archaeon]
MTSLGSPPINSKKELVLWTKRALEYLGVRPSKKLGQSFSVDPNMLKTIADVCCKEGEFVVEIGSGLGALTRALLLKGVEVLGIEMDERLARFAHRVLSNDSRVHIVVADARKFLKHVQSSVVGNVPYCITSDLIIAISKSSSPRACITVQLEVAHRLVARPGTKNYGRLTIITDYLFKKKLVKTFPPASFYPVPEVSSALVFMERVREFDRTAAMLENITKCLFTSRRKKVRKVLARCVGNCNGIPVEILEKRVYELGLNDLLLIVRTCL